MQLRTRHHPLALEDAMEAIANPRRRQILRLVWDAERSAGEIAAASDVSWPAVSQNLRLLRNSGLLIERREGTHRYYRVDRRALGPLEVILRQMWTRDLGRLKQAAEQEARSRRRRHD
jgi:DNA-binding transcriptional ArsR family regulator